MKSTPMENGICYLIWRMRTWYMVHIICSMEILYIKIYIYRFLSLKLNGCGPSSVSVTSGGLSWNETERVRIYNIRLKIHSKNEPVTSPDVS